MPIGTTAAIIGGGLAIGGGIGRAALSRRYAGREYERQQGVFEQRLTAAREAARATPEELASLVEINRTRDIALNNTIAQLARQEEILEATDPAFKEAGKQALELLQGKEAAILGPLREQRERDRARLSGNLRQQLGPGFEMTSAGMQALNEFDQKTSMGLATMQMDAATKMLGFSAGIAQSLSQETALAFQSTQAIQATGITAIQNIATRRAEVEAAALGAPIPAKPPSWAETLGGEALGLAGLAGSTYLTQQIFGETGREKDVTPGAGKITPDAPWAALPRPYQTPGLTGPTTRPWAGYGTSLTTPSLGGRAPASTPLALPAPSMGNYNYPAPTYTVPQGGGMPFGLGPGFRERRR